MSSKHPSSKSHIFSSNDYVFLSKLKSNSYFTLDTNQIKKSKELFKSKFGGINDFKLTAGQMEEFYNKVILLLIVEL
jgi:hypothetical protein